VLEQLSMGEFGSILNACNDGIYICDKHLKGIWVNQEFERISGVPLEVWVGESLQEIKDKGYISDIVSMKVIEQNRPVTVLQNYKNGKQALITGNPIYVNGEIDKIVTTAHDITHIKRLTEEVNLHKSLSEKYKRQLDDLKESNINVKLMYNSKEMGKIVDLATRISKANSPVLIFGETGVGKELVSRMIHEFSQRSKAPFVEINCGAIPKELIESELFGYESGSFTGASKKGKAGLFEAANRGTIFLDEIGEMPLNLQVKLLRVIQDFKVSRIGGTKPIHLDLRIIAATNRNLEEMVAKGEFREDLYYRLSIIPIHIPPLRDRKEDISFLCNYFLNFFNKLHKKETVLHQSVLEILTDYEWPGNVRELKNLIERIVVVSDEKLIHVTQLPKRYKKRGNNKSFIQVGNKTNYSLKDSIEMLEKELIVEKLKEHKSAILAAKELGISQPTMSRKMKKYNLYFQNEI
jgi:PAS domain S-box-containing protein